MGDTPDKTLTPKAARRGFISPAISDKFGPALFCVYLCIVASFIGALSVRAGFFPGKQYNSFINSLSNVRQFFELYWQIKVQNLHPSQISWPDNFPAWAPVEPKIGADELTLVQAFRGDDYGLFLVDADGAILHEWRMPADAKKDVEQPEDALIRGDYLVIDGASLSPNGDVVFTVAYHGVVKLDRCSRKIWSLSGNYHHSLSVDAAGDIWAPFRTYEKQRVPIAAWITAPFFSESVARLTPDGKVIEVFSIIDAMAKGKFEGLIADGVPDAARTTTSDITHLNDADIVTKAFAAANPFLNEGDIMVSMRANDAIAIIDRETRQFKYALAGLTLRQHDPDLLPNGNFLIYDNRTEISQHNHLSYKPEGQGLGQSRIIEVNPRTQEIVWSFEGTEDKPFFTSIQGKIEPLANGNVLVVEAEGGRAFEIDRATKEIIWQFANLIETKDGKPIYGRVTGASRHKRGDLAFLNEGACN